VKITSFILSFLLILFISSCNKVSNSPKGCVTSFIVAIEQHDMSKAWGLLGKDAQAYYNDLGEKQRRSGKGALENEINRIKTFRNASKDYSIRKDKDNSENVRLVVLGTQEFVIETVNEDDSYRIKNAVSVKNILNVIASEVEKQVPY
jgi:hypothetical protein